MSEQLVDITVHVLRIREAVRHVWNTALAPEGPDFDRADVLNEIGARMLDDLLQLDRGWEWQYGEPILCLHVKPRDGATSLAAMVQREPDRLCGYWDHSCGVLEVPPALLKFVNFYDWDVLALHRDLKYVRVRIAENPADMTLVGRDALIEADLLTFWAK